MSGTPTILSLIADSQKHAVNPADSATQPHASITTTNGSAFHTSSQKSAWINDSGSTNHMTFDHVQLINRKSSTHSMVSNANGTPSLVQLKATHKLQTSEDYPVDEHQTVIPYALQLYLRHLLSVVSIKRGIGGGDGSGGGENKGEGG
ncbi:unnamed protein product [Prunus armeniaca]